MALFGKRKRPYRRRQRQETIWDQLNWNIDPDTAREAIGFILVVLGVLILLGLFGLAGTFGDSMLGAARYLFGIIGFIIPFVLLILGIRMLMPRKDDIRASVTIGIILCFIFIPGLIGASGGWIGITVHNIFVSFLGNIGAAIALSALSVISLLIGTNLSFSKLMEQLKTEGEDNEKNGGDSRVPIFRALNREQGTEIKADIKPLASRSSDVNWTPPPWELLDDNSTEPVAGDCEKNAKMIEKTLADFGISVKMGGVNVGPTVSQYTLKPEDGVKLNQITARQNDLALSLAAKSLRVEAPIPGQSAVGIEIPNQKQAMVTLKEILQSKDFANAKSNLTLALGRGVAGDARVADLKKMPHLLIAGSTGSGKSVAINSILLTLLYENSPSDLRLLLVDPKRVEFTEYNGVPHLLTPVVTEVDKTVSALKWAVAEMERRLKLFSESSKRNIESYNEDPPEGKIPYIVIVIDELADLMAQASNEVEGSIVRLAQLARATGIHLIVATQRPSVNVITGLIKANIATRIAFQTASQVDSRTILDVGGAEKLLGRGDMLYLSAELGKPTRIQGVNVIDKEIHGVTEFLKKEGEAEYDDSIVNYKAVGSGNMNGAGGEAINDPLYVQAKETVIHAGKASATLLQRRLSIGYARAAKLLDALEDQGVIGPQDGSKPRDVLIDIADSAEFDYRKQNN